MRRVLALLWMLAVCAAAGYVAVWWAIRPVYHWSHNQLSIGPYILYALVGAFAFLAVGAVLLGIGRGLAAVGAAFMQGVRSPQK